VSGRRWLDAALVTWAGYNSVTLRLTAPQAERLQRDWYYGHAAYAAAEDGGVRMTYGEVYPQVCFALLRWLGLGAELLAPAAWRLDFGAAAEPMLAPYRADKP
jgi:hypothetical protein